MSANTKLNQRQRKALGWIVQLAVENFNLERGLLRPVEADDIYDDLDSLVPLLDEADKRAVSVLLVNGGPAPEVKLPELKLAA